jgi:hypothetical protein
VTLNVLVQVPLLAVTTDMAFAFGAVIAAGVNTDDAEAVVVPMVPLVVDQVGVTVAPPEAAQVIVEVACAQTAAVPDRDGVILL